MISASAAALAATVCGALTVAGASAAELHGFAGYAIARPLEQLAVPYQKASGDKLVIRYGTAPQLAELIRRAKSFDFILVPSDVLQYPGVRARLTSTPPLGIARVGLAVAVRAHGRKPDIGTAQAFRVALLQARSIATVPASATGMRIMQVLDQLGIREAVTTKLRPQPTPAQLVTALRSGSAQLGLFLSNVLTAPGVELVGPFPDGLQQEIAFVADVAAASRQQREAEAFLRYLQGPAAAAVLRADGLAPGG